MKLNLGSAHTTIEGFTNVDVRDLEETDIVGRVDNLDFCKDGEVEEIICSHCLEHFSYYKVMNVVKEWNRVMKQDGILYVAVPDIMCMLNFIVEYGWGVWQERLIFGDQDYPEGAHLCGFTFDSLRELLTLCGFTDIRQVEKFPLDIKGKTASTIQYPDRLSETGKGKELSLNVIAKKAFNIMEKGVSNG